MAIILGSFVSAGRVYFPLAILLGALLSLLVSVLIFAGAYVAVHSEESMFGEQNRLAVAVIIKNIVKKVYGVSMATSNLLLTNFYFSNTPTLTTMRHSASSTKPLAGTSRMTPARLSTRKAL